jgi:hypothetical protein
MLTKSHGPTQAELRAALGRTKTLADATPRYGSTGNGHASSGASTRRPRANKASIGQASTSVTCRYDGAVHDIAALREGTLSSDGIRRLAHHLPRCESCRFLVAGLVSDAQRAECTGQHEAPRPAPRPK